MDRLRFTFSLDINQQRIHQRFSKTGGFSHIFFTAYEDGIVEWEFCFYHSTFVCVLTAHSYPIDVPSRSCSCKFTLKQADLPNVEFTLVEEEEIKYGTHSPRFKVPKEHGILKSLAHLFLNPKEMPVVLQMDIELPKNSFLAKYWPFPLKMAPEGWEKDKSYRNLTVEDKHNFHIVCKDGVFYAKKKDLTDYSGFFMEKFEEEWKNKNEVELEISLETMKMASAYYFTRTFIPPQKLTLAVLTEITEAMYERIFGKTFAETMDVFVCRHLTEASLSLHDLISWWRAAFGLFRVKEMIAAKLDKNHYSEIMTHYKADAKFLDNEKKEFHKMLHEKIRINYFMHRYQSLFEKVVSFHEINQKMTVTELANAN